MIFSMADHPLARHLNPEQLAAVRHAAGPCLIIAGPGTGKTRVLACRIAWLIQERHAAAEQILAVTFTNKAAEEIRRRVQDMLGAQTSGAIPVFTFHGFGYELLRRHCELLGRTPFFSLIDEPDRVDIVHNHLSPSLNLNLDRTGSASLASSLSRLKQGIAQTDVTADLVEHYEKILRGYNAFDLDDLVWQAVRLLRAHERIARAERERFPWISVDEYQDINPIQYELLRLLAPGADANLCVIGDPDQAIYGFRGANVSFIRDFSRDFPNAKTYNLKTSYRCPDSILRASQGIVRAEGIGPRMLSGLEPGLKIRISSHPSDKSEAEFISRTIEHLMGGLSFFSLDSRISQGQAHPDINSFPDFAVLCRLKAQLRAVEKAFRDHNIPCQSITDTPFFKDARLRPLCDVLRLAENPDNLFLRARLQNNAALSAAAVEKLISMRGRTSLGDMLAGILAEAESSGNHLPVELKQQLMDLGREYADRRHEFLKLLALGSGVDAYHPQAQKVTLLTMHSAKGLEFPCVFVTGCEDGIIPYRLFPGKEADEEEERRLLYVAMTRAQKMLFLSHAHKRFLFGKEYQLSRSPFLDRIELELLEQTVAGRPRKKKNKDKQMTMF